MKHTHGQSTVEYAVLIVVVMAALLAMGLYMKRGTMGKLRESTDSIGSQFTPLSATTNWTRTYDVNRNEVATENGQVTSNINGSEVQDRKGDEHIVANILDENVW